MSLLDDLTARGVQIRTRLRELLQPHSFYNSTKERLLAGYVAIALEHHCAIWLLTERHKHGAALSLVRTVMDAWLHALWINKMATAAQMEKAWLGELKLPMSQMREQIKKAYFGAHTDSDPKRAEKVDAFFQSLKDRWKTFSGYTHPSGLQVSRRFTGDKVKANYGEGDIAETLDQATTTLMQLAQAYFVSMAKLPEAREVRTLYAQYCADFDDRLKRLAQAE